MNIQKELSEIAEKWTEPEYRARPELSQSTLGTYEKLGFDGLEHLFDHKETPSLTFGSCVDAIITGGEDEFNANFMVIDVNVTDGGINTCKQLVSMNLPYDNFNDIPEQLVSDAAKIVGFWQADKWDRRRYSEVLKTGNVADYYKALRNTDKTLIDIATYQDVLNSVRALRESPATSGYFADDDPLSPIRRYYQLKFRATFEGVGYRGMMDEIVVDYENKKVFLIDLKTSSKTEWNFYKSFIEWGYCHQARLYYRLVAANMAKDPYFRDFEISDYYFIVVNRKTLQPLVWKFTDTKKYGELTYGKNKQIVIRDPFTIGSELQGYLNLKPLVPNGINIEGPNDIVSYLEEM